MCGLCGGGAIIGAQCGHLEPEGLVAVDASETFSLLNPLASL